VATLN